MSNVMQIDGRTTHPRKGATMLHKADNPTREDVAKLLEGIRGQKGQIDAEYFPEPKPGAGSMRVHSDRGRYVIEVSFWFENGDHGILHLLNEQPGPEDFYVVHEEAWFPHLVTFDFELVAKVFEEFALTGKIQRNLFDLADRI